MWPYVFVLVPLVLYLIAIIYETFYSFKRLTHVKIGGDYLSATWEITHTLLILAVVYFITMFSLSLRLVASAVFISLFVVIFTFIIRGILYMYIFYIRTPLQQKKRNWVDWLFALTNVVIIAALGVMIIEAVSSLWGKQIITNSDFIIWMLPGLVLVLAFCSIPVYQLYKTKK